MVILSASFIATTEVAKEEAGRGRGKAYIYTEFCATKLCVD
jgi:hypothetical protein